MSFYAQNPAGYPAYFHVPAFVQGVRHDVAQNGGRLATYKRFLQRENVSVELILKKLDIKYSCDHRLRTGVIKYIDVDSTAFSLFPLLQAREPSRLSLDVALLCQA